MVTHFSKDIYKLKEKVCFPSRRQGACAIYSGAILDSAQLEEPVSFVTC